MLKKKAAFGSGFINWCNNSIPNALVLAFLLTIIVAILVLCFTETPLIISNESHKSLVDAWTGGFWNLLTFAMQMSLVMLTGYILAAAPVVKKGLSKLAEIPTTAIGAMLLCGIVTFILFWIHWGLGMMSSVVLAQQVCLKSRKKGFKIHMASIVAYIYAVELCCNGISQAAPLYGATAGYLQKLAATEAGASWVGNIVPLTSTVLTSKCIIQNLCLFAIVTIISIALLPKQEEKIETISDDFALQLENQEIVDKTSAHTFAEWMNNSVWTNLIIGLFGMIYVIGFLIKDGIVGISLNNYNFMMLMLGLLLCKTPAVFNKCVAGAIGSTAGVIIQFPFYAGIFGLISYTGFNEVLVHAFTSISTQKTFPAIAFIYSGILNMVVPSGGSKFVIEAPYLLDICAQLKVPVENVINAYTFGDMTTNIIQPFWALPIVGLFKTDFKKIFPYTFIVCVAALVFNFLYILIAY